MNIKDILKAHRAGGVLVTLSPTDLDIFETHIDKSDPDAVKLFEQVVEVTKAIQQFDAVVFQLNKKYLDS